ncbi:MAG TPA: hypothetical protein VJT09_15965 [Pyrinomonadaceae bacterium]|nr:hypothetical protein [Pyrinomonadaceae bacterium]
MGVKEKFTTEEWKSLLRAPMLVSYAVAGSDPSGKEDFIKEMSAVADAIIEGGQGARQDSLVSAVVSEIVANADDDQRGQTEKVSNAEVKGRALENCRAVAGLLREKAPAEDADEYKKWIVRVAHRVASAAKEGGFLGFGGTQISDSEVEIINEIGAAIEV